MEMYRLKIKIGEHEFEAEGPTEVVQMQFEAFKELVAGIPREPTQPRTPDTPQLTTPARDIADAKLVLEKIMRQDGRVVSLTARGGSLDDEILLVLFGQKLLRNNDAVTGGEIVDGLKQTGRIVNRVDYNTDKMTTAGDVITVGVGRGRKYRLSNQGMTKAQNIALGLLATVA